MNGQHDLIARTAEYIRYRDGQRAPILLDFDRKGMPPDVAERIKAAGGFWQALVVVVPELRGAAHLVRQSTSAGLSRTDTGAKLDGSGGLHVYVVAVNGADAVRFLTTLHDRCWLTGFGWMMVGAAGQLLERSIVDRMVGQAERLAFEGAPVLEPPLVQDADIRRPLVTTGETIDTVATCPPLTLVEQQELRRLKAVAKQHLQNEALKVREAYIATNATKLATRTGVTLGTAKRTIAKQCDGILLADIALSLDALEDPHGSATTTVVTVGDVLDNPASFEGWTLGDPLGGRAKATIMRRADGTPWIYSWEHGGTHYKLRYDARSILERIGRSVDPIETFVKLALQADIDEVATKQIIDELDRRTGIGVRVIAAKLKAAKKEHTQRRAEEVRERRLATRTDPRPQIGSPAIDAERLPHVNAIDDVLAGSSTINPPSRDADRDVSQARMLRVPGMHAFTDANDGDER